MLHAVRPPVCRRMDIMGSAHLFPNQERACVRRPYGAQKKLSESRFYPAAAGTADGANQLYALPLNLFR